VLSQFHISLLTGSNQKAQLHLLLEKDLFLSTPVITLSFVHSRIRERMQITARKDDIMTAQDNIAVARSLIDLYNNHQSDPEWLDKSLAAFAADSTFTDVPSGRTLPGRDGYRQLAMFFAEAFPESSVELTNVFATEDQLAIEFTGRGANTGTLHLPTGDIPATGRYSELRFCEAIGCRNGKITSLHIYYDNLTLLQNLGLAPAMG
jgi:steroid delta-isomerase-like uncharacterized protein